MLPPPPRPSIPDDAMSQWAPSVSGASSVSYTPTGHALLQAIQSDAMSTGGDEGFTWDYNSCKGCTIAEIFGGVAGSRAAEVQWDNTKACALTYDGLYRAGP